MLSLEDGPIFSSLQYTLLPSPLVYLYCPECRSQLPRGEEWAYFLLILSHNCSLYCTECILRHSDKNEQFEKYYELKCWKQSLLRGKLFFLEIVILISKKPRMYLCLSDKKRS
jgi:hypothetical protein